MQAELDWGLSGSLTQGSIGFLNSEIHYDAREEAETALVGLRMSLAQVVGQIEASHREIPATETAGDLLKVIPAMLAAAGCGDLIPGEPDRTSLFSLVSRDSAQPVKLRNIRKSLTKAAIGIATCRRPPPRPILVA